MVSQPAGEKANGEAEPQAQAAAVQLKQEPVAAEKGDGSTTPAKRLKVSCLGISAACPPGIVLLQTSQPWAAAEECACPFAAACKVGFLPPAAGTRICEGRQAGMRRQQRATLSTPSSELAQPAAMTRSGRCPAGGTRHRRQPPEGHASTRAQRVSSSCTVRALSTEACCDLQVEPGTGGSAHKSTPAPRTLH